MTMAEDVDVKIIKKTQDKLGKYIKKPPLQEKLLKRPPFRFIHDIITNVIKTTSLFKGLYTAEELISDNVKDKESKLKFLQKSIDAIMFVTGDTLTIKPSKVVAGQEAAKTNEFLQCIAKALKLKLNSDEAVQNVLNGEKPGKSTAKKSPVKNHVIAASPEKQSPAHDILSNEIDVKKEESPRKTEKSEEPKESRKSSRKPRDQSSSRLNDKNKEKSPSKNRSSSRDEKSKDKSKSSKSSRKSHRVKKDASADSASKSPPKKQPIIEENNNSLENGVDAVDGDREDGSNLVNGHDFSNTDDVLNGPNTAADDEFANRSSVLSARETRLVTPRPPSAKGPRRRNEDESGTEPEAQRNQDETPKRRQSAAVPPKDSPEARKAQEPMPPPPTAASVRSARPASRGMKSARPSSARPAPPKIRQRDIIDETQIRPESVKPPSNIILHDDDDENEDETFLVEEAPKVPLDVLEDEAPKPSVVDNMSEEEAQGRLVKQLLETKKDLEGGSQRESADKTEIEKPFVNNVQRSKQREQVSREIEKLRGTIQTLTRSANPLGKLMDYLQEDIDSMQKECKMWHDEFSVNTLALKQEESLTESSLEPLRSQLADVDGAISDQQDKIHNLKNKILHNEEKLQKILNSINFSAR